MTTKTSLRDCEVFKTFSESELAKISDISSVEEQPAGAAVFREGTDADTLYVLQDGKVALQMQLPDTQARAPRRVSVDIVTRNEMFGWSALVEPHRYTLMAICLEPTRVLAINAVRLRSLMEEDRRVGYELLHQLVRLVASRLEETRHVLISERGGLS
ncbi:MAG: cyclic nucleotide-binding domain-containing protein [Chloroflexi bacterium]|nr:cyclic nucleotide-binding domain-containing protein [Chloroflexota bacterium]